jgi:molybdate transport system substrate-binding protein
VATLNVFSAGAAQAVVSRVAEKFEQETAHRVSAAYGAVGAMQSRVIAGEPADVIVLTAALIDGLIGNGWVAPGSRADLGKVGTGVAVRAGAPVPDVGTADALRATILASTRILCPDPAVATAGKVVLSLLERLGIVEQMKGRLAFFPNGYAAMGELARAGGDRDTGITQVTEIIPNKGVAFVGALPPELQSITVYSAGLAARAEHPELAKDFMRRLTGARDLLTATGYQLDDA